MTLRPGLLLALATLAGTSFAQPAPPRRDLSTMDRFEWAAPLSVPPIKVHRMARHGLAQSVATSRGLQGRVLWIDATANVGRVNSDEKIAALMKQVAEIGFNTVVYDVKPILGYTMYPSRLTDQITRWRDMRMDPGYDPLAAMLREGKKNGLNVMVALNAFSEGHRFSTRDANLPENPFFKPGWGDSQPDLQTVRYLADPTWRGFAVEEAVNPPQIGTGIAIYSRVPNGPADATSPADAAARPMADARRVAMSPVPPASGAARAAGTTSSGHSHHAPIATMGTTVAASRSTSSQRRRCRYRAARAASGAGVWSWA